MAKLRYITTSITDAGARNNEDSLIVKRSGVNYLLAVADGVGGLDAGEVASGLIVKVLDKWFEDTSDKVEKMAISEVEESLQKIVLDVHDKLKGLSRERSDRLGSTITAALVRKKDYVVCHVGDSRAYLLNGDSFDMVTADQTVAEYERRTGKIITAVPEAKKEFTILQCVGQGTIKPDIYTGELGAEYSILICSDGLSNTLDLDEAETFMRSKHAPKEIITEMTRQARAREEKDNITAVMLRRMRV